MRWFNRNPRFVLASPRFKTLKKNRRELSDEEREKVMKAKATWSHGPKGEATPAVWKAVVDGETWFITNTHRAFRAKKSLEGAIREYHDFIEGTS